MEDLHHAPRATCPVAVVEIHALAWQDKGADAVLDEPVSSLPD